MGNDENEEHQSAKQRNLPKLFLFRFSSLPMDEQTRSPPPGPNHGVGLDPTAEDDTSSTLLDLSSFQLHDLDSVELPSTLTELDLTANRLSSLDARISNLSNLKKLSLRQNLMDDAAVEPISSWHALSGLQVFNLCLVCNFSSLWIPMAFGSLVLFSLSLVTFS